MKNARDASIEGNVFLFFFFYRPSVFVMPFYIIKGLKNREGMGVKPFKKIAEFY